jgi:MFS family permease
VTWAGEEGRAIGLWTSFTSVATIAGPALGGLLVDAASWRWIFVINVPLALVVVALALAGRVPDEGTEGRTSLDVVGAVLAAVGLLGVSFALVEARSLGIGVVVAAGGVGALALLALALWTARASDPLVPRRLLRRPGLAAANVVTLVLYAALAAHLLFLPVYLQFLGLSAAVSGAAFALPSLGLVLLAPRCGRLADRIGPRRPITVGCGLLVLSLVLLVPLDSERDAWTWGAVSLAVWAVGLAAVVAPITAAALAPAPSDLAGVASGLNQTAARAGGVLSVAAVGALAGWAFAQRGGVGATPFDPALVGASRAAGVDAFRVAIVTVGALAAAAGVLAATLLRDRPSDGRSERRQSSAPSSRNSATLRSSPPA